MALNVKQLNSDASFLLTMEPIIPEYARGTVIPHPFTILLDPWITGPSTIFHSKISISTHKVPPCVKTLAELPEPDLVIISQHKTDHCNEATLRQLPGSGTKTQILAEPASARLIRSWRHFDPDKVHALDRWEDPRLTGKQTVTRIPVPPLIPDGQPGEVTVAFIPQKRDLTGVHNAIGITYRPPPTRNLPLLPLCAVQGKSNMIQALATPPGTPPSPGFHSTPPSRLSLASTSASPTGHQQKSFLLPPSPPISPGSPNGLRSVRSAATLMGHSTGTGATATTKSTANPSPVTLYPQPLRLSSSPTPRPSSSSQGSSSTAVASSSPPLLSPGSPTSRPLSIIFSPHGVAYQSLSPYATSHLVSEAALPVTALLHCMDTIANPWWLGGNICAGAGSGAEIAARLGARVWISAHDGEKDVRGLATGLLRTRIWGKDEVERALGVGEAGCLAPHSPAVPGLRTNSPSIMAVAKRSSLMPLVSMNSRSPVVSPTQLPPATSHPHPVCSTSSRRRRGSEVSAAGSGTVETMRMGPGDEVLVSGNEGLLWYSPGAATKSTTSTTTSNDSAGWSAQTPTIAGQDDDDNKNENDNQIDDDDDDDDDDDRIKDFGDGNSNPTTMVSTRWTKGRIDGFQEGIRLRTKNSMSALSRRLRV